MAEAIKNRTKNPSKVAIYKITVSRNYSGELTYLAEWEAGPKLGDSDFSGVAILKVDWSSLASVNPMVSTLDVGEQVLKYLFSAPGTGISWLQQPIHLIGHSRGTSVNAYIAYILGQNGIWVDHVTTLDPHPWDGSFNEPPVNPPGLGPANPGDWLVHDTESNVIFADNYWRANGVNDPFTPDLDGRKISGAYDRDLNGILFEYYNSVWLHIVNPLYQPIYQHTQVHAYYHGTIDRNAEEDGDGIRINYPYPWFSPPRLTRDETGFRFSLIADGQRPGVRLQVDKYGKNGLAEAFGGNAARPYFIFAPGTIPPQWPNVMLELTTDTWSVQEGSPVAITYRYSDSDSAVSITFGTDDDQNPYNVNTVPPITTLPNLSQSSAVVSNVYTWLPQVAETGRYFYAKIQDGPRTRYYYFNTPFTVTASTGTVPVPPSNLQATAVSSSRINLTWADNSSNKAGFKIERSVGGGSFVEIARVTANTFSYADLDLAASTTYSYRVKAYNGTGTSTPSAWASATTLTPPPPPPQPMIVAAAPSPTTVKPGGSFTITFTINAPAATTVMLGASIRPYGNSTWTISDPAHDVKFSVPGGINNFSRQFMAPADATWGTYDLLVALWQDVNNNNVIDSGDKVLATQRILSALTVTDTADTMPPTVSAFSVTPSSVSFGGAFGIQYRVSDTGGSGLKQVELRRANDVNNAPGTWVSIQTLSIAGIGNGPFDGVFSDTPPNSGDYWYGVRVVDNAGSWNDEKNSNTGNLPGIYGPIKVTVTPNVTVNNPPSTPINYAPGNGETGSGLTPSLYASPFADPDGDGHAASQWIVRRSSDASMVFDSGEDSVSKTSRAVPSSALTYSTTYNWQVRYKDSRGTWSGYSTATSFTTFAPPPLPVTRTLSVASSNPNSGVGVDVYPYDINMEVGRGTTPFTRTYDDQMGVTARLIAPFTAGDKVFQKWQKNGVDATNITEVTVRMDADYTMTAVYVAPPPLNPPFNLQATAQSPAEPIMLTWSANWNYHQDYWAYGEYFYLEMRTGLTGAFVQRSILAPNTTSFAVTSSWWPEGETFCFRMRAYSNATGYSDYSNEAWVTIPSSPPTAYAATSVTTNGFTANWSSANGATGYRLDVSTSSAFSSYIPSYQDLDVGNVLSQSVSGLSANTTYYYRVRAAYVSGATSANSGTISVTTPIADTVGDGILDPWRLQYFPSGIPTNGQSCALCDADGDGMNNLQEYQAGFNPSNTAAYLHVISVAKSGNDIKLTYLGANGDSTWSPGIASRTNVLEAATGAPSGSYSNNFVGLATNILSGGTGLGVVTNMVDFGGATNSPSRYYRVRLLP